MMEQITAENRPRCQRKDCNKPALTLYCGMWLCGDCFSDIIEKETKLKQQHMLEA